MTRKSDGFEKKKIFAPFLPFLLGGILCGLPHWAKAEEFLRVRLHNLPDKVHLQGTNLEFQGQSDSIKPAAWPRFEIAQIEWVNPALWKIMNWQSGQLVHQMVQAHVLAIQGQGLQVNDQPMPERLLFFSKEQGIEAIAVLGVEHYLKGVLASEMPASWPLEALKAQAVASRTYALYQKKQREGQRFHLESSVMDQVFSHDKAQRLPVALKNKILQAVEETRGVVLKNHHRGQLIPAYFHADSGGQTEEAHEVWGNGVFLGTVKDPVNHSGRGEWQVEFSQNQLIESLHLKMNGKTKEILNINISLRTVSGRAKILEIQTSDKNYHIAAQTFRRQLGFFRLKSTYFEIQKVGELFRLTGRGFGHGVGMSQWGARRWAQKNKNYREILSHYYPKAELTRMKPLQKAQSLSSL